MESSFELASVILGDIGGTNIRLRLLIKDSMIYEGNYLTNNQTTFKGYIDSFLNEANFT